MKMKKTMFLVLGMVMLSCNSNMKSAVMMGGDRDEHGCIGSAGYTWSDLRKECIRVFEVGTRLNPIEQNPNDAVISAFVVFDEAKNKVEIFLPQREKTSIILDKKSNSIYENEEYKYDDTENILMRNGKIIYRK